MGTSSIARIPIIGTLAHFHIFKLSILLSHDCIAWYSDNNKTELTIRIQMATNPAITNRIPM